MRNISLLIKPASSACNLRCRYCFYADEAARRSRASAGVMSRETAAELIRSACREAEKGGLVSFAFQGGEPTVAGLDFFRFFVKTAREEKPAGVSLAFSMQTNGTLLDGEWASFLRDEGFLVGLSVDGFKEAHDLYRPDAEGKGTWNRVRRSAELLQRHQVEVNALCVVTRQCARSPQKAYETLKRLGFRYLQFIACLDPGDGERGRMPWSLTPEAYGEFLCRLFDLWYLDWEKGDYHSVRLFDDYVHLLLGDGAGTCATCGRCGCSFVVEADGTVYPCDFFALDEWKAGKIGESGLSGLADGETFRRFLDLGREKPAECAGCRWRTLCNGGCVNDWVSGPDGDRNYYCDSFRKFFAHAEERLLRIARAEREAALRKYR
jgi:uncharacterized protein